MPINTGLRSLVDFLKSHLFQLNLFNTGTQNEDTIRNERRSTRFYLFLLITSVAILAIYYSVISYQQTMIIQSPTFSQYSDLTQQMSLECPCSTLAVKYDQFIEIEPDYDELCQSDFVSDEWMETLLILYEQSWNKSVKSDFRRIGLFQFQTIRLFCQLTKDIISNALESFQYTDFIQSQLISQELFQAQISSFVTNFIDATPKTFLRTLQFVQDTTAQSLFMSGASLTSVRPVDQYRLQLGEGFIPYPGINYTFTNGFTCVCSASTATSCMGLATFEDDIIPGFQTGCYMLSALMNSTLEAFYNQTFVDILSNSTGKFSKLNSSDSNGKLEMLLSQMFVKVWTNTTSFEKYFQNCAPDSCQYTITHTYSVGTIILLLIGLFGGLSAVLRVITPIFILRIWPMIWRVVFQRRAHVTQIVVVEVQPAPSMGMRVKILFEFMKQTLFELNLFPSIPPSEDEIGLRKERRQTRIYLGLLLTGLFIFTLFLSIRPHTTTITVLSPSLSNFVQLYEQYPLTLDCPCSQTTLKYNEFISYIEPQYHQICLSDFISQRWIDLQFVINPARVFLTNDIRYQSQIHFQLLSTLCRVANQTIEQTIQSLYQTKFVTNQVLAPTSFQTHVDLIIEEFKRTVPESYQRTLQLIQANSEINQFIVPLNSDFGTNLDDTVNWLYTLPSSLNNMQYYHYSSGNGQGACVSKITSECSLQTGIASSQKFDIIPGMYQTFFPLQSVLLSTLECFYNDTCLTKITRLINPVTSPTNFSTLQLSALSFNDSQYDQIDILANKLFIQSWKNESSYQSYFNQCHPLTCQYTYQSEFNILYIVTTIIGLLGGLNIALRLLIPLIFKVMSQIRNSMIRRPQMNVASVVQTVSTKSTFLDRFRALILYMKKSIMELNLFPTIPPSQDEKMLRRSRRITRIYLMLLMISIFILAIYTSLRQETTTVIVKAPSISTYSELFNQYPVTLQCPCSHIAIKYDKFITQIEPQYHPICSSVFVSSDWITLFDALHYPFKLQFDNSDFRSHAKAQFETVARMCSLSRNILNLSLPTWLQTDFVTARIISRTQFDTEIEGLIEEFKSQTANEFMQTFKVIQTANYANQLATTQLSNWQFLVHKLLILHTSTSLSTMVDSNIAQNTLQVLTLPQTYGEDNNCSCILQSNCSILFSLPYHVSNQSLKQPLPGFRTGCLPLDALFQSSFACLYNQTCFDIMRAAIYYSKPIPAEILTDSSLSSQDITTETYLSQLFVTEWFQNVSFDDYFNEYTPQSCQYSYTLKFNRVYFVTTIIALFGGLTKGLHFIVFCAATVVIYLYERRKKNRVTPDSQQSNNAVFDLNDTTLELASIPPITTIEVITLPIREPIEPSKNYRERAIMICLSLFVIVAIVTFSVLWFRSNNTAQVFTSTSTTTMSTSITIIESTTTTTTASNICYMTLVYQLVTYPIGLGGKSLVVGDFNQDSISDIAVTNYDDGTISVLLGNGNETFQMQQVYSTGNETYPWGITTGDFNNDTFSDLAVTLSTTNQVAIFFGIASNGSFTTLPYTFTGGLDYGNTLSSIEAADLNGDGFIDLVIGSHYIGGEGIDSLYAVLSLGGGYQYRYCVLFIFTLRSIESIAIGDFDNNGRQNDISAIDYNGQVSTMSAIDYTSDVIEDAKLVLNYMFETPQSLIRGRFNDDELDDLAVVSSQSDTLQVLLAYGDGTFTQQIDSIDSYPTSVVRINFNNDSIDDLAVLTCNQTISIYLGTNSGLFHRSEVSFDINKSSNECAHSLRVADFNQDGKVDLVFIDPGAQSVRVLLSANCNEHI